jgi:cytochrome c556
MTPRKITAFALVTLVVGAAAAVAMADTPLSPEQAVAARQAAMKEDGRALRGSSSFTGDKAVATLEKVKANYDRLPALFIKDSITGKSVAKPIIWQQFDQFSAIFKKGSDAAVQGIAAAKAGDTAGYQAAIKTIAGTCDECHQTYREKLEG